MEISCGEVVCFVLDFPTEVELWNSKYVGIWKETDATLQLHNLKNLRVIYRVRQNKGQCRTSRVATWEDLATLGLKGQWQGGLTGPREG